MLVRSVRYGALALGLILALAGCGGSSSTDRENAGSSPVQLTLWADGSNAPVMEKMGARFTEKTGVPVRVETIARDLQTQFVTASQAGTGPDLVMGAHDWIGNLVQNGAIDPIPMTEATRNSFLPKAIEGVTFNNQIYGVPFAVENVVLYRNTDLAPDAPKTIEEIVATGNRLKSQGKVSEVLALPVGPVGDAYHMYPLLTSGGGAIFGRTLAGDYDPSQLELGTPEAAAAMAKVGALGESGKNVLKRSISADNLVSLFAGQKTAFMVSGPWNLPAVRDSGVPYDISPVPGFEGAEAARPFVGVQALYLASRAQNKALAQEFATNFFATPEVAEALFAAQPRPPALTSVYEKLAADNPDIKKLVDAGLDGDIMPSITAMALVFDPLGKAEAAVVGGADPAATMRDTASAIRGQIRL